MSKTWFITGTSRGFGRAWTEAALSRGDRVAATARNTASLDDLVAQYGDAILPLQLDVTDRDAAFAIVQVSSIGGVDAFPSIGIYHASKWALEGLTEALAQEVGGFGIHTTLIEPAGFATVWAGDSAVRSASIAAYDPQREAMAARSQGSAQPTAADSVEAVLAAVDADIPPTRLLLSSAALAVVLPTYDRRVATWREWETVTRSADPS
jgi:NAD(P)-dependent dehydrogenase (short-subunit alcohol dehydrogenase family)